MAQTARHEAEKAEDSAKYISNGTAFRNDLQKRAGAVAEVQNQTVRKSTEGVAEFSKLYTDLLREQAEHNLQTSQAFANAFNWNEAIRVQSEFLRTSFERMAQLNSRYIEIVQGVMTTAASSANEQAKKAA
jgi:phasin family protein